MNATPPVETETPTFDLIESRPRRILLRLPNWVGDIVMAAPTVAAVGTACPEAELTALVRTPLGPLAGLLPCVKQVLMTGADRTPHGLLASARRVSRERFDAAVVFPRGTRAMLPSWLAGVPVRVGFGARGLGALLTHPIHGWRPWRRGHRSAWFGLLALPFGARVTGPWHCQPPPAARATADRVLRALGRRPERPLVVLEPGAAYGPAKCWPPSRFGELARRLVAWGADVCTIGTAAHRDVERRVGSRCSSGLLRAVGRTPDLTTLVGLLARADLVISNDTGPMHLAAATGVPVLAFFGASDPAVSAPDGPGPRRVLWEPEPCSPCFLRRCPIPGHPCLERFSVEYVLDHALSMCGASETSGVSSP